LRNDDMIAKKMGGMAFHGPARFSNEPNASTRKLVP